MASRTEQRGEKDSSRAKPISDMDPEGMDSDTEGQSFGAGEDGELSELDEEEDEDVEPPPGSQPHNRRESDRTRTSPPRDRR
jgi:hypothetical protein